MDFATILQILDSAFRLATPLMLACFAGLFSERSGIFDIGLEGKMLAAAFTSAAIAAWAGAPVVENPLPGEFSGLGLGWSAAFIGLFAGILVSILLALLHGFASITLRGNQLISGVAINFLASGLTVVIGQSWFRLGGQTPQLVGDTRFSGITLPFADAAYDIPVLGPIYAELISGHNILVYIAFAMVPVAWWVLYRTRFGLRLRAVGENPGAVDTAGISVVRLRYSAVIIAGLLCGIAGAYLSMGTSAAGFVREMTAGKGFIALAALIFAKWRPLPALGACLLFGFLEAVGSKYQSQVPAVLIILGVGVLGGALMVQVRQNKALLAVSAVGTALLLAYPVISITGNWFATIGIPVQFMQALPYILVVVILAGFIGKAIPPKAGGIPYVKER